MLAASFALACSCLTGWGLLSRRDEVAAGVDGVVGCVDGVSGSGLKWVPGPVSSDGSGAVRGSLIYVCAQCLLVDPIVVGSI